MPNRVNVKIGGTNYTVIADDPPEYVQEISAYYNTKLAEMATGGLPVLTAAILAGVTVADEYFKSKSATDSLVNQIREYVSETTRMRGENGELRRELERARLELERYRNK